MIILLNLLIFSFDDVLPDIVRRKIDAGQNLGNQRVRSLIHSYLLSFFNHIFCYFLSGEAYKMRIIKTSSPFGLNISMG